MNEKLEKYLEAIDKCLKPLPTSERVDIVKEIKSSILEMEGDNLNTEQILDRLGDPKDLAKAYLGGLLEKGSGFSFKRLLTICAFYSIVSFSGMVVIPCLIIMAPMFIVCGVISPLVVGVKMIDYLLNLGLPYMENIGVFTNLVELNPIGEFVIAIIIGDLFFHLGIWSWKLLVNYCQKVSEKKSDLSL